MLMSVKIGDINLDWMVSAVEKVRQRLLKVASILEAAGIPYAVVGGNAVAAWVSRVDEAAVRNTKDVDILLRRSDLPAAIAALEPHDFRYRHAAGVHMFLDGPDGKFRDAVHLLFAGELLRADDAIAMPDVDDYDLTATPFRVVNLESLVAMKLLAFRDKDRTHLRDFIEVGLIDETWPERYPPELAARLQSLLDTPGG